MKYSLLIAFLFITAAASAQKRFDCIVYTMNSLDSIPVRRVGQLRSVEDSSILITIDKKDIEIKWSELMLIRFRNHDGFMRTFFPISLSLSTVIGVASYLSVSNSKKTTGGCGCLIVPHYSQQFLAVMGFVASNIFLMLVETPIYFLSRNHTYKIESYKDFQLLRAVSKKYIRE